MALPGKRLPRLVLATLLWLVPAFVAWYFLGPLVAWLVRMLLTPFVHVGFADILRGIEQDGHVLSFITRLRPGDAQSGNITVDVNVLLYAYGMPMFAALTLAAREPRWWMKLAIGLGAMLPLAAFGVFADCLKNLVFSAGPLVAAQTGFAPATREVIAFCYQFGALIVPTVAPAAIWVLLHRRLLESLRSNAAA